MGVSERVRPFRRVSRCFIRALSRLRSSVIRLRAMRRSVSSWLSPGPLRADAGADRAAAAAEPLEVLPGAAHARQVVLELRQLDLELALGRDGVLGEDVEDQLRAVDDAGGERVLERPLLRRRELVVDEEHLRASRRA